MRTNELIYVIWSSAWHIRSDLKVLTLIMILIAGVWLLDRKVGKCETKVISGGGQIID